MDRRLNWVDSDTLRTIQEPSDTLRVEQTYETEQEQDYPSGIEINIELHNHIPPIRDWREFIRRARQLLDSIVVTAQPLWFRPEPEPEISPRIFLAEPEVEPNA